MKHVLMSSQMKECDRFTIDEIGIPSIVLMEKAALGIADECMAYLAASYEPKKAKEIKIICACGLGNNGGDGAACARILRDKGYKAEIILAGDEKKTSPDMAFQLKVARNAGVPFAKDTDLKSCGLIVDALFGVGLSREITGNFAGICELINASDAYIISADIPSGISADTGQILGTCVNANATVAIQALKPGHVLNPGAGASGKLITKDIGIKDIYVKEKGIYILEDKDIKALVPLRDESGNKGTFGKILVIAGSEDMCGAAILSCSSAMRSGAGMVRLISSKKNKDAVLSALPEAMLALYENPDEAPDLIEKNLNWADVIVIGPGIGTGAGPMKMVRTVLEKSGKPLVIDADGLNCLSDTNKEADTALRAVHNGDASAEGTLDKATLFDVLRTRGNCYITPHIGEMSRLTGKSPADIKADAINAAENFAGEYNVFCILKDARTVIAGPEGNTYINVKGSSGMATAGSGDVLTGILGALIARGMKGTDAAAAACFLHSSAGDLAALDLGKSYMTATDIIKSLGKTFERLGI